MNAAARSNCARNRTSSLYSANASRARFINASASSVFSNLPTYTVTPTVVNSNNTNSKREMSSATVNSLARDIDRRRGSYSSAIAQSTSFSLKRGFPATITTAPPYGQQFHHINRGIASVVFKKNIFGDNTTTSNSRDPTKVAAHVEAAYQRGLKYHHGLGVDQNLEIALEAYQQAAFAGHAESCCALASMYANGEVAGWADYEKARQLYGIAALLGHPPAQFKLGEMYESGIGVGIDLIRAQSWYIEAAKRNYAPALCNLGTMYAEGDGCEPDPVRAVELLRMAADQGLADAQCCLGLMYLNGEGVEADEAMAEEYYMRAAEQGHALAQVNLGHLYYNQGNAEMAKECWELAAKQGVALALCNLGAMYMTGQGVQQSYIKAHEYYSQAAHKGDFEAQYQMGVLYENGHGVQKQPNTALSWFNKAAQQGHTEAKECALRLRGPLSSTNTTTIASTSTPPPSTQTPTGPTPPESISSGGKRNV